MIRILLIIGALAAAGSGGDEPRPPADPGAAEALSDPEWVEFLQNMEMLEEYGDLIDVDGADQENAKPDGGRGVNTGGDDSDGEK